MVDLSLPLVPHYTQLTAKAGAEAAASSRPDDLFTTYAVFATILFGLIVFIFETYLSLRQRSTFFKTKFPAQLEETVKSIDVELEKEKAKEEAASEKNGDDTKAAAPPEKHAEDSGNTDAEKIKAKVDRNAPILPQLQAKFDSAQSYGLDKSNFGLFSSTYSVVEGVSFLLLGYMPYLWDKSCELGQTHFGWNETDNEIKITLIFMVLSQIIGTITGLPFSLYNTFQIERKHGFNKQTIGLFFKDLVIQLGLSAVIGLPVMAVLLTIIKLGGDHFYLYVWAFVFVFSLFMMTIYPVFIMPLFNKYDKLPEGALKDSIYELAGRLEFPLTNLFVMDGSKRSSHSNAFMFGFFKNKRIVLFDTLMEQVHSDEILAILGHELGHWKMGHTVTNFVITQLYTGMAFYTFSLCYNSHELYRAFGFDDETRPIPTAIALTLFFSTVWEPIDKAISYAMTVHSRKCEFEADEFSVNLGMSQKLQTGLCKIHLENLGSFEPDPWYSTYHYSHPPLVERLSAMMRLEKKSK